MAKTAPAYLSGPERDRVSKGLCRRPNCGKKLSNNSTTLCEKHLQENRNYQLKYSRDRVVKSKAIQPKTKVGPNEHYDFAVEMALSRGEIDKLINLIKSKLEKQYEKITAAKALLGVK